MSPFEKLESVGVIFSVLGVIFVIIKSFINSKILTAIQNNHIHTLGERMDKIDEDRKKNEDSLNALYTKVNGIDERCKATHK